jgi:diguanylate cyclase (GGDEF)-like protein
MSFSHTADTSNLTIAPDEPRFLIVDDDEVDSLNCQRLLQQSFGRNSLIDTATNWDYAVDAIEAQTHDVYIIDQNLGGRTGLQLIQQYRKSMTNGIFILLTGEDNRAIDLAAAATGASDFLLKTELTSPRLERSIRFALSMNAQKRELISTSRALEQATAEAKEESRKHIALAKELKVTQDKLRKTLTRAEEGETRYRHLAQHDVLTELPNRMLFADRLDVAFTNKRRQQSVAALMHCDLDHFKHINDSLGHQAGDFLLTEVARRLTSCVRDSDTVARFGGDEFAILLTNLNTQSDAANVAEKIVRAINEPFSFNDQRLYSGISIGIAVLDETAQNLEEIMYQADLALYRAKASGRGQYQFFDNGLNIDAKRAEILKRGLSTILNGQQLYLEFQPKIDLHTGKLNGVEALARWQHSTLGRIPPSEFIPMAEASGQILTMSEWIFEEAARAAKTLEQTLGKALPISVNLSAIQLKQGGLQQLVERLLETYKIAPSTLELEITETSAVQNLPLAATQLQTLRDMGVKIAIDDFGTGYSSLAVATKLPADQIKIDQTFVSGVLEKSTDTAAVNATVILAHSLDMSVVAEGVETTRQLEYLTDIGCNSAQGFLIGRPMREKTLVDFCLSWHPNSIANYADTVL